MSTAANLFLVYLLVGLVLMVIAVATRRTNMGTKETDDLGTGDKFDATLLLFIALMWPIWLVTVFAGKSPRE